jgi:hypothetical protein
MEFITELLVEEKNNDETNKILMMGKKDKFHGVTLDLTELTYTEEEFEESLECIIFNF